MTTISKLQKTKITKMIQYKWITLWKNLLIFRQNKYKAQLKNFTAI